MDETFFVYFITFKAGTSSFCKLLSCIHLCRTAGSGPLVGHKGGFTWRFRWLKITTGGSFSRRACNRFEALFFFPTSHWTASGLMGREPGFSWTELTVQRCCVHHPVWNAQHPGKKQGKSINPCGAAISLPGETMACRGLSASPSVFKSIAFSVFFLVYVDA